MVNTYGAALQCEAVRAAVFAGRNLPHVFGPPTAWVALLAQALQLESQGHDEQAATLRAQAFEQAPASPGQIDGQAFAWLADADSRLGPVLEVIINGRYGWLPLIHVRQLDFEPVTDLRDLVWVPAHIQFINGGETVALVPSRYPGSGSSPDMNLQMARKTEWMAMGGEQYKGLGQWAWASGCWPRMPASLACCKCARSCWTKPPPKPRHRDAARHRPAWPRLRSATASSLPCWIA